MTGRHAAHWEQTTSLIFLLSRLRPAGSTYYVRILSTLDREKLKPNVSVALHRHSHSVVDILPPESDSTIQLMQEKPDVSYNDIGGMDIQKQVRAIRPSIFTNIKSVVCVRSIFQGLSVHTGRCGSTLS